MKRKWLAIFVGYDEFTEPTIHAFWARNNPRAAEYVEEMAFDPEVFGTNPPHQVLYRRASSKTWNLLDLRDRTS